MISTFLLKAGRALGVPAETIATTPLTIFVGPNNSGKSKVLSEIEQVCRGGQRINSVVLETLSFADSSIGEATKSIEKIKQNPNPGETSYVDQIFVGSRYGRMQVPYQNLLQAVQYPQSNLHGFCTWFLTHKTLMLNGQSRIGLITDQPAGDLQLAPQTSLQVLFKDDAKRSEVRRIISEAFGTHFVVDPTNLGHFRIRLSQRPPVDASEERGIDARAVNFHSQATHINEASDGVKAFTGMIMEIMAGDPQIVLVDEPEAFLHPSLASKLGLEVALAAISTDKRVFVSTHSPMFVTGCIQSGVQLNIIRLTYRGGTATSRVLPSNEILQLMRNPLLRSTGILNGLFYEFVVITEGDADRAFYQEINERLLRFKPEWGIPDCLFINAQNKQTLHMIIKPLRKLGIPAVGIADIDVLKEGGAVWTKLLDSANVPGISLTSLGNARAALKQAMDASGRDMKRDGGVAVLNAADQEAAANLFDQLAEYGIFTVRGGELESWLKPLRATGHGPSWLIEMFELMGEDVEAEDYLMPSEDDVWCFVSQIKQWLVNPVRKGIPN